MEYDFANVIQNGSMLPITAGIALTGLNNDKLSKIEIDAIKKDILSYLKTTDKIYISDLAEALRKEPKKIVLAVKELKEEGLIMEIG